MEYLEFLIALIFHIAKELKIAPHISIIVLKQFFSEYYISWWLEFRKGYSTSMFDLCTTLLRERKELFKQFCMFLWFEK